MKKLKIKQLAFLFSGILMFGMVSCEYQTIVPNDIVIPDAPVDFSTDIEPIFTQLDCIRCHTSSQQPDLTAGNAYASLIGMNLLDTLNPGESLLIRQINSGHNTATNMTSSQKGLLLKWITEGAKGVVPLVSFKNDVEPIFTAVNCISCHAGSTKPDLRTGKAYASLTSNNFVKPNDPDNSKLIEYINASHNTASSMTGAQKNLVLKWIIEGAKNN